MRTAISTTTRSAPSSKASAAVRSGRGALLAGEDALRRRRHPLHRAAPRHLRERRHRHGRSAGARRRGRGAAGGRVCRPARGADSRSPTPPSIWPRRRNPIAPTSRSLAAQKEVKEGVTLAVPRHLRSTGQQAREEGARPRRLPIQPRLRGRLRPAGLSARRPPLLRAGRAGLREAREGAARLLARAFRASAGGEVAISNCACLTVASASKDSIATAAGVTPLAGGGAKPPDDPWNTERPRRRARDGERKGCFLPPHLGRVPFNGCVPVVALADSLRHRLV